MSAIQVTATGSTITASATSSSVAAAVGSTVVQASATGGLGPQGPQGVIGPPGNALSAASDVHLSGVAEGDLLQYSDGKWRNNSVDDIVDFGNF